MALDQVGAPPPKEQQEAPARNPEGRLSKDEMQDTEIAFGMMRNLLTAKEGNGVLMDALSKPNPAPALSLILSTIVGKVAKKMDEKGLGLSPRVWLAEKGAVDRTIDHVAEVAKKNKVPFDDALQSQVFGGVVDQLKLAQEADANGENSPPEGEEAPPQQEEQGPSPPMAGGPPPMMGGA